jgi:hypothetical protein
MSKRLFATTLILALAVTPFAAAQEKAATASAAKAPRLTLTEPIKDFGTVPKGEVLDWSFEVRNTGTSDLEIISVRPACGCTVADFDKVIKPGGKGKITAKVDTTTFVGPIAKSVSIETNDASTPVAQVTISAVVKPYVEAHPRGFVRFNILQGEAQKERITLYSEDENPFEIISIESPQEWIKVDHRRAGEGEIVPTIGRAGQAQYLIDITVGGDDARIGPLAEKIRIVTNSPRQPEYSVSVSGVIRPSYRVEPTGVNFGDVAPTESGATRTIIVRSNDLNAPEKFVVSKVESGIAGVSAAVKPTATKGEYEVTLQIAKDAKPGAIDGPVMIHTSDRAKPVSTVPVKGSVKAAASTSASK